ncbi:DUF1311 domain-containing protein [Shimwellia pseudoproteus]|uniref:lysozyme inhibitor LprI family protein n=1 Tax=Shimwellia pseudoproteus TaxID=570012 RepID=UPI0018EB48D0|nr:lysozyme inhibitor LprI family protein [Shimwellia pseudoproteus]MBJ3814421.1 DUF1311 domain-containing protein [Shimwellia pseudoproteus]
MRYHPAYSLILFSAASFFMLSTARAGTPETYPYSAAYQPCITHSSNELDMLTCISDEHQKWDARLNKIWQQTLKERQNQPAWRQAQRTWIKFRDQQCDIYNYAGNGSGDKTLGELCLLNMTIERTLQLENPRWPAS